MNHVPKRTALYVAVIWLVLVLAGFRSMDNYIFSPTTLGGPPDNWPSTSRLKLDPRKTTMVIFLHPYCPCSKASVHALIEIMKVVGTKTKFISVFVRPIGVPKNWEKTPIYQSCLNQPGLKVVVDDGGFEAGRFGAKSSGITYVFNDKKLLIYSGGITNGRGMEKPGSERKSVIDALTRKGIHDQKSPVFGCSLL